MLACCKGIKSPKPRTLHLAEGPVNFGKGLFGGRSLHQVLSSTLACARTQSLVSRSLQGYVAHGQARSCITPHAARGCASASPSGE